MSPSEIILRLILSVFLGTIIGIEREKKSRPAGTRTHILVCVGAAIIAIMENLNADSLIALNIANPTSGVSVSYGRMIAQVISGVGFLGAGTIFMAQKKIAGLTTAASLWCSACLGLAAGMGYYILVITGASLVIITLSLLPKVVHVKQVKYLEVKFIHRVETLNYLHQYFDELGAQILDVDFHVENKSEERIYTNLYTIDLPPKIQYKDIVMSLSEYKNIVGIRTRNI